MRDEEYLLNCIVDLGWLKPEAEKKACHERRVSPKKACGVLRNGELSVLCECSRHSASLH
jgi:hypothetical protein